MLADVWIAVLFESYLFMCIKWVQCCQSHKQVLAADPVFSLKADLSRNEQALHAVDSKQKALALKTNSQCSAQL